MWNVPTKYMCDKHILGEHVEIHMFIGSINKGKQLAGYVSKGLLDAENLFNRHEQLVKEMTERGMNHRSPLPQFVIPDYENNVNPEENLQELFNRCLRCRGNILMLSKKVIVE
jgi:hypothetical protein